MFYEDTDFFPHLNAPFRAKLSTNCKISVDVMRVQNSSKENEITCQLAATRDFPQCFAENGAEFVVICGRNFVKKNLAFYGIVELL